MAAHRLGAKLEEKRAVVIAGLIECSGVALETKSAKHLTHLQERGVMG